MYVQYNTDITFKSTWGNGAECYVISDCHKKPRKVCYLKNQNKEINKDSLFLEYDAMWNGN
jgi:hypothetical protein